MLTSTHSIMNTKATGDSDFDALQKQLYRIRSTLMRHSLTNCTACRRRSSVSSATWAADKLANVQKVLAVPHRLLLPHPQEATALMVPTLRRQHPPAKARVDRRRTPKAQPASVLIVVKWATSRPTKSQQVISFAPIPARKKRQRKSLRPKPLAR
jgi:hypothetical protein